MYRAPMVDSTMSARDLGTFNRPRECNGYFSIAFVNSKICMYIISLSHDLPSYDTIYMFKHINIEQKKDSQIGNQLDS